VVKRFWLRRRPDFVNVHFFSPTASVSTVQFVDAHAFFESAGRQLSRWPWCGSFLDSNREDSEKKIHFEPELNHDLHKMRLFSSEVHIFKEF
jgi:hypothetical protein